MRRWISRILTAISLLTALAIVVFWIRSSWQTDSFAIARWRLYGIESYDHQLTFGIASIVYEPAGGPAQAQPHYDEWTAVRLIMWLTPREFVIGGVMHRRSGFWGFIHTPRAVRLSITNGSGPYNHYFATWTAPDWFLALAFLVGPVIRVIQECSLRERSPTGHCPHCGYDLRATPDRCSECGTVVVH